MNTTDKYERYPSLKALRPRALWSWMLGYRDYRIVDRSDEAGVRFYPSPNEPPEAAVR
jgi:hypothetical protein